MIVLLVGSLAASGCATGGAGDTGICAPDVTRIEDLTPGLEESAYAVPPELLNREEVVRTLETAYPPRLRDMRCGGTTRLWFHILADGTIDAIRPHTSSGFAQLDFAAQQVAVAMEFAPAMDESGAPIPVWIVLPVTMESY